VRVKLYAVPLPVRALAAHPTAVKFVRIRLESGSLSPTLMRIDPESIVPVLVVLERVIVGEIVSMRRFEVRAPVWIVLVTSVAVTVTEPDPWVAPIPRALLRKRYWKFAPLMLSDTWVPSAIPATFPLIIRLPRLPESAVGELTSTSTVLPKIAPVAVGAPVFVTDTIVSAACPSVLWRAIQAIAHTAVIWWRENIMINENYYAYCSFVCVFANATFLFAKTVSFESFILYSGSLLSPYCNMILL
jgi:hypothetical protein